MRRPHRLRRRIAARNRPAVPPDMTQEQFDSLVNAITKSVLEKLKSEGVPAAGTPPAKPGLFSPDAQQGPDELRHLPGPGGGSDAGGADLGPLSRPTSRATRPKGAGRTRGQTFLLLLALTVGGALACEAILRRVFLPLRSRLARGATPDKGLRSLTYVSVWPCWTAWASSRCGWSVGLRSAWWFSGSTLQDKVAFVVLAGLLTWRLYALVFRVILRPGLPPARLCDMDDDVAWRTYGVIVELRAAGGRRAHRLPCPVRDAGTA